MKTFGGPVLFLDRSDINTDEIIPAKYLTEVTKDALKSHVLEDLHLDGVKPCAEAQAEKTVIVTRANFGCGSSREHAPWVLEVNDITLVVAENFARIFRQNMYNCGMMAVELAPETLDKIFALQSGGAVTCAVDLDAGSMTFTAENGASERVTFDLSGFDEALVKAGGWVEFADARY